MFVIRFLWLIHKTRLNADSAETDLGRLDFHPFYSNRRRLCVSLASHFL